MTREQLAHVLRAVAQITDDPDVLVIGSQSILGSYSEDELPPEATGSMEVDTAFLSDPDGVKSDVVDVNIGEFSEFHNEFGYYPQGVSVSTGVFPAENYLPVVVGVAVVGDHVLRLLFSDGMVGDVDFSAERWTGVLEPLSDPACFAQVRVDTEAGTIAWPNGIDLAPEPLYEQAHAHPLVAA